MNLVISAHSLSSIHSLIPSYMEVYYLRKRYTSISPEAVLEMTNNFQNLYMLRSRGEYGVSRIIMQIRTSQIHTPCD